MANFLRTIVRAGPSQPSKILSRGFLRPSASSSQAAASSDTEFEFPSPTSSPSLSSTSTPPTSTEHSAERFPRSPYNHLNSSAPSGVGPISPPKGVHFEKPPAAIPPGSDPDAWWAHQSANLPKQVLPGNQYSGRSFFVRGGDPMSTLRRLAIILSRTGVKKHVRRGEFHETPSERKRRLGTERHRRRFQEMVREKVQTVQMIRSRG